MPRDKNHHTIFASIKTNKLHRHLNPENYNDKKRTLFYSGGLEAFIMQTQKDDIRRTILQVARAEFSEKGFKDTSMRTIAQKADVGLSNIYNYFRNKDEIFREILSPVLLAFDKALEQHNHAEYINLAVFSSEEYLRKQVNMHLTLINDHKEDLRILFFRSSGSSLEDYQEELIERHTRTGMEYLGLMKQKYPEINADISPFFIHTMCAWFMSSIVELVMHDLSHAQMQQFIREYMEYSTAGWKRMMRVE